MCVMFLSLVSDVSGIFLIKLCMRKFKLTLKVQVTGVKVETHKWRNAKAECGCKTFFPVMCLP